MATWDEQSSEMYRRLAAVVVPRRAEQMAALLTLLPFDRDESFRVVELASGEGRLAHAVLAAFPNATLLALDLSESMRETTARRLAKFGDRARVGAFDMAAHNWYGQLEGADAVLSSLCIHHLDAAGKQALFAAVSERLSERGAFLIADLVLHTRPQAREWFAATYDAAVREQADDDDVYQQFLRAEWNYYRFPDEHDQPSPLFDQLIWLWQAGFHGVDCFWMQAGHAVFGGYKSPQGVERGIAYEDALKVARAALADD